MGSAQRRKRAYLCIINYREKGRNKYKFSKEKILKPNESEIKVYKQYFFSILYG
jgi:hypothetical protein